MTSERRSVAPSDAEELAIADLIEEFVARVQTGESISAESFADEHPAHAEKLRGLLPGVQVLADLEPSGSNAHSENVLAQSREGKLSGLLGDFRILREVGKGGMGVVYEAEQISLRRRVAVKVLPFAATMDPRHLQRFHNEARAAASLHHPHIVPVYFVGCERGVHFYAMQFIDGQSLESFLRPLRHAGTAARTSGAGPAENPEQPRPPCAGADAVTVVESQAKAATQPAPQDAAYFRRAAEWGIAVAVALEHAHSLGIVHRDIKPANLLLDTAGRMWVTDFGLARTVNDAGLTLTGDLLGTLRYMSPEQALAKHGLVDHRTDIYSLGVTLFELLTLRPAIDGLDREEVLKKIAFEEPCGARQLNGAIPVELETIVRKAMSKEPAERYATAKELADDLHFFLDHKPIRARPPSLLQRMRKWARRNLAVIWTAGAVLVLAAAALAAGGVWHMLAVQATLAEISQREREVRQHLYVQDIVLAWQALREGERERMRGLLDRHVPESGQADLRGFEWYYLQRRSRGLLHETARVAAHEGGAYCVTYSPDGRTLASAGKDGSIRFWDARTLSPRGELHSGQGEVNEVAFAPDGKTLASAGDDGTVCLWDVASARQRAILRPEGCRDELSAVAISPDGKILAAGGKDGQIWSWDLASGRLKAKINPGDGSIYCLSFVPDGRFLAAASHSGRVLLLDPDSLRERERFQYDEWPALCVSFSNDRRRLATGYFRGGRLVVCDLATRWPNDLKGHDEYSSVRSLSFSPDDTLLVSGLDDGRLKLWNAPSGSLRTSRQGHADRIWSTAFAPSGEGLATAGGDGTVKLWHIRADDCRTIRVASESKNWITVDWIAFARDGQTLFTRTSNGDLQRWDTFSGRRTEPTGESRAWCAALAPGSRLATVALNKRDLRVQDLSGSAMQAYRHEVPISAIAISPDGERVAFADGSPAVWMWQVGPDRPRELSRLSGVCNGLAFAPDGGTIAVEAATQVKLLDSVRGQILAVLSGHEDVILGCNFSPDGRLLATSGRDSTVRVWEFPSGRERYCLWKHRISGGNAVAFSPDGKTLASSAIGGEVILWSVAGGRELMRLDSQKGQSIRALAFSPDGKVLAAAGEGPDGKSAEVFLWYADRARPNPEP